MVSNSALGHTLGASLNLGFVQEPGQKTTCLGLCRPGFQFRTNLGPSARPSDKSTSPHVHQPKWIFPAEPRTDDDRGDRRLQDTVEAVVAGIAPGDALVAPVRAASNLTRQKGHEMQGTNGQVYAIPCIQTSMEVKHGPGDLNLRTPRNLGWQC